MADKEFEFHREDNGSLSRESAIFQALGAASVCWDFPERAGVFHSEEAKEIGEALFKELFEKEPA